MKFVEQSAAARPLDSRTAPEFRWFSEAQVAEFGVAVHDHGLAAYPLLVQELAQAGRNVSPTAAAVLASESEPTVARERALAVVSAALVRTHSSSR
jgi:hypothetical protein